MEILSKLDVNNRFKIEDFYFIVDKMMSYESVLKGESEIYRDFLTHSDDNEKTKKRFRFNLQDQKVLMLETVNFCKQEDFLDFKLIENDFLDLKIDQNNIRFWFVEEKKEPYHAFVKVKSSSISLNDRKVVSYWNLHRKTVNNENQKILEYLNVELDLNSNNLSFIVGCEINQDSFEF